MDFRLAERDDLPAIMAIVRQAQASLKEGGVDQWQNGYPTEEVFLKDMSGAHTYVVTDGGTVVAMASVFFNDEPTYDKIYDGEWLSHGAFLVAHRMAVDNSYKRCGVAGFIFDRMEEMCRRQGVTSIKIDTHRDNIPMRTFLVKRGFIYCGIIYLLDGNPRVAYEKLILDGIL